MNNVSNTTNSNVRKVKDTRFVAMFVWYFWWTNKRLELFFFIFVSNELLFRKMVVIFFESDRYNPPSPRLHLLPYTPTLPSPLSCHPTLPSPEREGVDGWFSISSSSTRFDNWLSPSLSRCYWPNSPRNTPTYRVGLKKLLSGFASVL